MSLKRCCFFVLLMLFYSPEAYSQDNFSWEMFLPGITNQCRPDGLFFCRNQQSCEARGGYWYNQSCHVDPEKLICDKGHLDLCVTEQTCLFTGGYWYELSCHQSQSPNFIKTGKLAGDWYFSMSPDGDGSSFVRTYLLILNISTITEYPVGSGEFTIKGIDQDWDAVTGGYVSINNNYTMFVTKTTSDVRYVFTFITSTDVIGCYHDVDKDGTQGQCVPMQGTPF